VQQLLEIVGEGGSVEASEIAVGRPAASSLAKVGPEITASGIASPSASRATSCSRRPVSASRPFVAQTTRIRAHQRFNLTQHFAKDMARHHHQNIAAGRQRGRKVAFKVQRVRERNVREKRDVAAVVLQRRDMFRVMAPQDNLWPFLAR
jgi:hypothetical protein